MSILPSAISAGASMFGSILGAASARANNKLQQKAMELQDYQFRNKTQIRMEDYKKAGINPILAGLDGGAVPAYNMNGLQNVGEQLRQGATDIGNLAANLYNAKEARKIQEKDLQNKYIVQEQQAKQAVQQTNLLREQAILAKNENYAFAKEDAFNKFSNAILMHRYGLPSTEGYGGSFKILGSGGDFKYNKTDYTLNPNEILENLKKGINPKQFKQLFDKPETKKPRPNGMYGIYR